MLRLKLTTLPRCGPGLEVAKLILFRLGCLKSFNTLVESVVISSKVNIIVDRLVAKFDVSALSKMEMDRSASACHRIMDLICNKYVCTFLISFPMLSTRLPTDTRSCTPNRYKGSHVSKISSTVIPHNQRFVLVKLHAHLMHEQVTQVDRFVRFVRGRRRSFYFVICCCFRSIFHLYHLRFLHGFNVKLGQVVPVALEIFSADKGGIGRSHD